MKQKLFLFMVFCCTMFVRQSTNAQTILAPGDIAFIGYQTGGAPTTQDGFSFITLKDMTTGTLVYFTEKGWNGTTWVTGSTEPHLLWTVPAFTPAGTIVSIVETTTADVFTIMGTTGASITFAQGTGFNLSGGDQMLVYQSATGPEPILPTFITGVHADYNSTDYDPITTWNTAWNGTDGASGGNESVLPPGLTNGVNCVSLFPAPGPEIPNSKYTGTLTGTSAALSAAINNPANWSHHSTNDLGIIPTSYPTPSVSTLAAPTVTSTAATSIGGTSAVLAGNVTNNGGDPVTERGIVWATTVNPTTSNNKVTNGSGNGVFSGTVGSLPSSTLIYFRAYAINGVGTSYGAELSFTTNAALATSSTSQTNIACNGASTGSASVTAIGGAGGYTYSWSPSGGSGATASSLPAGSYTVTITDAVGVQITRNFTIVQPSAFTVGTSQTNVSCNGGNNGTATVSVSGATGPYTYSWSPSGGTAATATGLTAGSYTVTITDANSCQTTRNFTITQPSAFTVGTSQTNVSCNGGGNGTATVSVSGATGPYTYSWAPSGGTNATATGLTPGSYTVTITDNNACQTTRNFTITQPSAFTVGTSQTNVSCNGGGNGTATVSVSGATGPYTYSWAPSGGTAATASGLTPGSYTVTITDNNTCQTTRNFTITQPSAFTIGTSQTNVSCNGGNNGTATVSVSGATGPYFYSWSPSGGTNATATGLSVGSYTVTITDNNACQTTRNFTIVQPTALTATTSQVNALCSTPGQASVTVSGGTPGYTYSWAPSGGTAATATGLLPGSYTVTITDANACQITRNFTIVNSSTLDATTSQTNVSCNGGTNGTATVTATGGAPGYTYSWAPSGGTAATASGLTAGTYTVTIEDTAGCTITRTVTVTQPAVLNAIPGAQTNIACNGGATGSATVNVTGGTGAYTYSWAPTGGTAATATGLAAGTYTVTVTDANACTTTQSFTITQPSAFTITPSQTNVSCNGGTNGTASVVVSGATGPYTYSWAPTGGTAATASGLAAGTYTVTITDANLCTATQSFTLTQPTVLDATASAQTNIACNGGATGSATVTVTGGTGAYTYSWAPSGGTAATATGLTAGTYTVTVTDANGCTDTQSFTINQPTVLNATASAQTNIACNGAATGSATVAVTGGTPGYTYSWSPSGGTAATATGLTAGGYIVTVTDANGCTDTQSFTITQPPVLNATAGAQTNIACNGASTGSATVAVTGGTPGYTYSWAPSGGTAATATGLTAGTYTVTVTDANACTDTQSFTITQPAAFTVGTSQTNVSCNGGTNGVASVTVSGGTPAYTYSWSPSGGTAATASGLVAGNYTVTITDGNLCTTTRNFTITQPSVLNAMALAQTNIACNGGATGSATVAATGGTGAYTYSWAPSGGTAATATGLTAGTYTVTVTDANGCTDTQSFTVTQPSALTATTSQTNVSCNGGANGVASVTVSGGTPAYTYSWAPSGGTAATATGLAAGSYTVTITDANACQITRNITVTQPSALTATTSQTNVSCNGGANGVASVIVSGGTPGYTYSWSPSGGTAATATGLVAGSYTVTITDANACQITRNITVTQPAALTATSSQTNVLCNGGATGTAGVTVSGGTGTYTYVWSPSGGTAATATGLVVGNYSVLITDANGCTLTRNFTITQPTALTATTSQVNLACNGGSNGSAGVTVSGGTGAYTYSWSPSGGTAATATGLTAGSYSVLVTDANGCTLTRNFTLTQPSAITATTSQTNVSCNGGANGIATVTVSGGTGAYTYSWSPSGGTAATASGLAAGTYIVTITDANACSTTRTVTITQPTALTATTTQTNVSCNGGANGTATITVSGGTGAYTYSWSPSGGTAATASGLAAGTYTVTVTDANGCQMVQSFTITQPTALALTLTSTNVSCPGYNDGTASSTVTGGVIPYTYLWSNDATTSAITDLPAGSYSVTVTDANGCTITQSVTVATTPDITAAVPDVTNLPTITNYCQVLEAEIAVPTATDNCNGIITATTTDQLNYTAEGTYTITWTYNDGNGNTSTQTQTIVVEASPLDQVTFDNATFTYNGSVQSIEVNNLPAGATIAYSITPATGSDNGAVNAGVYTVTATLTPSAEAFNCGPVVLTATITIDRAPQTIAFDAIPVKNLENDPDFQLGATATSGLPVYYTYTFTAPEAPATVTATGFVDMFTSGEVLITAHQDGNENYLPATSVEQLLVIESSNATISNITIGSVVYETPSQEIYHLIDCGDTADSVNVSIVTEANAEVIPAHEFTIQTPAPGIYTEEVTVISQDGTVTSDYTVVVERRFDFFDIVVQKFDNVLLVNNNPQTNGGYEFVAYEWYKNGQVVGTGQYYSAGNEVTDLLDPASEYYVRMTTTGGDILQTCIAHIELTNINQARLYPNPVEIGRTITIEADFPTEELKKMQISIYSLSGSLVTSLKSTTATTEVQLPSTIEAATYIVVLETPNIKKTFKVIVDKN